MELKDIQNYRNSSISVPPVFPFFPYKSYDPHHQSILVGWEACLTLFKHKVFSPLFFPFFFVWKVVRKRLVV